MIILRKITEKQHCLVQILGPFSLLSTCDDDIEEDDDIYIMMKCMCVCVSVTPLPSIASASLPCQSESGISL